MERINKKIIDVNWVYKLKLRPNGEISKWKARLVTRGFLQKLGIYFNEVYAFVARLKSIITIMATTTYKGYNIHQLDVKSTFLNGPLDEEVYVSQPLGFEMKG